MTGFGYNVNGFGVVEPSVPYILEWRLIGGGGSTNNWFYASGGGAAGAYVNYTITEPAAGVGYTAYIGAGGAARSSGSDSTGVSGTITYLNDGSSDLATAPGGSYSSTEVNVGAAPPEVASGSKSGGAGVGPTGGSTGVPNAGNQHTNGYYGGDSSPPNGSISTGENGGGGAGHGGDGGDAGNTANSAGAGGAGVAWHDGVTRGGGGGGCQIIRAYNTVSGVAAGGSGGGGAGGGADYNNSTNAGSGTANTGGGAGGGGRANVSPVALGGAGGSGVAVVRYQGAQRGTGGTITSSGGYTYHTFTTSGTFTTA